MTATSADTKRDTKWSYVLSLLIGPLSWATFFMVGYLVAEASCEAGMLQSNVGGFDLVVVVVVALGLLATLISAWGALWGYRRWRDSGRNPDETEDQGAFLALATLLLNLLFLLATLMTAVGMLFILPCQWT